jgi:hypothetical protein
MIAHPAPPSSALLVRRVLLMKECDGVQERATVNDRSLILSHANDDTFQRRACSSQTGATIIDVYWV